MGKMKDVHITIKVNTFPHISLYDLELYFDEEGIFDWIYEWAEASPNNAACWVVGNSNNWMKVAETYPSSAKLDAVLAALGFNEGDTIFIEV